MNPKAIEAVIVDGVQREQQKTYGLWLSPTGNAAQALEKVAGGVAPLLMT